MYFSRCTSPDKGITSNKSTNTERIIVNIYTNHQHHCGISGASVNEITQFLILFNNSGDYHCEQDLTTSPNTKHVFSMWLRQHCYQESLLNYVYQNKRYSVHMYHKAMVVFAINPDLKIKLTNFSKTTTDVIPFGINVVSLNMSTQEYPVFVFTSYIFIIR